MKPSKASSKNRLVDTWSNKAMQARGEEPVAPLIEPKNKDQSPLVDTWANKADKVRANADRFNQVEGMADGDIAEAFNSRRERIKCIAEKTDEGQNENESGADEKVA